MKQSDSGGAFKMHHEKLRERHLPRWRHFSADLSLRGVFFGSIFAPFLFSVRMFLFLLFSLIDELFSALLWLVWFCFALSSLFFLHSQFYILLSKFFSSVSLLLVITLSSFFFFGFHPHQKSRFVGVVCSLAQGYFLWYLS